MKNKIQTEILSQPGYYAIIPANVRYAKIIPNAKLLYGEITALCNKTGYCWASNKYFAELYDVSTKTISTWLSELENINVISFDSRDNQGRKIYIISHNEKVMPNTEQPLQKGYARHNKKVMHNNTSNNTEKIDISKDISIGAEPTGDIESVITPEVFDSTAYTAKMLEDKQEHIRLIAFFINKRELIFNSKAEIQDAISRHARAAKALLKVYTNKDIAWSIKYCKNKYPDIDWTLDTARKVLTSGNRSSDGTATMQIRGKSPELSKHLREHDATVYGSGGITVDLT